MKYSVFTTANKSYFPFVDIFVNSLTKNCSNLNQIYIADCGLGEYCKHLQCNDKVSLINTDVTDEYSGVHSKGWVKATQQKTRVLYKLLKMYETDDTVNNVIIVTHTIPDITFADTEIFGSHICEYNTLFKHLFKFTKLSKWIFGHTHQEWNINHNNVDFICNPRGRPDDYNREKYSTIEMNI